MLEEDGDLEHEPRKYNIVHIWIKENGFETYLNCHNSPNLVQIENC